jgi:hypothetical protein
VRPRHITSNEHGELDKAAAIMTSMNTSKQNGKPVFMRGLIKRRGEAMKQLLMSFLLLAAVLPAQAEKIDPRIFGRWKIASVADFAG